MGIKRCMVVISQGRIDFTPVYLLHCIYMSANKLLLMSVNYIVHKDYSHAVIKPLDILTSAL